MDPKSLGISWPQIVIIVAVIVSAIIATRVIRWLLTRTFDSASETLRVDPTRYKFFKNMISMLIWIFAFGVIVLVIPRFKALAITLFASAGILVAIIGIAAQQAFSNIVSGMFIVIFKPFRVGDIIKVGTHDYGIVEDITLRHTVIRNFENKRIVIPNSVISSDSIVNDSLEDSTICRWVEIGVSYDSDVDLAIKAIQEVCIAHPHCIDTRTKEEVDRGLPQVEVRQLSFGDFSQNLRAYVWTDEPLKARPMHSDINRAIKKKFDELEIEIPFPYRTIVYKKDID